MNRSVAALISWRPFYQSISEPSWTGQRYDGVSDDYQNFLKGNGGYFYGYAPINGTIKIERLSDDPNSGKKLASVKDVNIYWFARHPQHGELCLVGWYEKAEVFRERRVSPIDIPGQAPVEYYFKAKNAHLFPEAQRPKIDPVTFGLPSSILRKNIKYLDETDPKIKNPFEVGLLKRYLEKLTDERFGTDAKPVTQTAREIRRRAMHETIERSSSYSKFRYLMGNECQACHFQALEEPWSRALEMHHLVPMKELDLGTYREVTQNDFALLCANCHRAIHATEFHGSVSDFWKHHRR